MVVLTKIYTKTGDKGNTSLGDFSVVSKDNIRVCAFGSVDEANSILGIAVLQSVDDKIKKILLRIQNDMFDCGADLCVPQTNQDLGYEPLRMTHQQTEYLEKIIDDYNQHLPPLTSFILPGGTVFAAHMHHARTVVRRAEREVVMLSKAENINPHIITFLNRLSDMLFVLARFDNFHKNGDVLWVVGKNR